MLARRAFLALMLVIIAAGGVHGAAGASVRQATPPAGGFRLEVPYVPQSGALCGGAALAMVLRYWGEPGVHAGDFSALVEPARGGIATGALQGAALARGWDATVWYGSAQGARDVLAEGKPLIVLVQTRSGGFHYLVLVGWNRDGFVVHDPQVGPGRTWNDAAFASAWAGARQWALLVLPSPDTPLAKPVAAAPTSPRLGRASELFRSGDWAGAAREAEQALAAAPDDIDAVRLLAGSHFLEGDVERALRAWNRLGEPRVDLLHVEGARRLRQAVIAVQLDLPPGRLVTPRLYRQARRRLAEIPVAVATRLELRPAAGGITRVDVALLERPLFDATPPGVFALAVRTLSRSEAALELAGATGNGELCTAAWRWSRERRRLALAFTLPAPLGRPGLATVSGFREEQAYRTDDDAAGGSVTREERRQLGFMWSDWSAAENPSLDLRRQVVAAVDTWEGRGSHIALGFGLIAVDPHDRLRLGTGVTAWASLRGDDPFAAIDVSAAWASGPPEARAAWLLDLGAIGVTREAPMALWPGAGTGTGREPLLRAHPLLADGVIDSEFFGRRLARLTVERRTWFLQRWPMALGLAAFVDLAGAATSGRFVPASWGADAGIGLRWRLPGRHGNCRFDIAHGITDDASAFSFAWQGP